MSTLVFYCCVTITPKTLSLEQHIFIVSRFLWVVNPGAAQLGPPQMLQAAVKESAEAAVSS